MRSVPAPASVAWRHPEWWILLVALAGWLALAPVTGAAWWTHAHHGQAAAGAVTKTVLAAAVMSVAMMAPLGTPAARHVAMTTFRSRRHRAQAVFLVGYLGTWTAIAFVIGVTVAAVAAAVGADAALAATFALAALWQLSRTKKLALARCRTSTSLTAEGWRATWDCASFGVTHAWRCSVTCACLMAAVTAAGHAMPVMATVFAIQVHERFGSAHRPLASAGAVSLVGLAAVVVGL